MNELADNWAVIVVGLTTAALVLEKVAQSSDSIAKILGPVGRWTRRNFEKRSARHIKDVENELARLALEVVNQITPADYAVVKTQLEHVVERLDALESENRLLRAFIVYDEKWHWHDNLRDVGDDRPSSDWMDFETFRDQRQGQR